MCTVSVPDSLKTIVRGRRECEADMTCVPSQWSRTDVLLSRAGYYIHVAHGVCDVRTDGTHNVGMGRSGVATTDVRWRV